MTDVIAVASADLAIIIAYGVYNWCRRTKMASKCGY